MSYLILPDIPIPESNVQGKADAPKGINPPFFFLRVSNLINIDAMAFAIILRFFVFAVCFSVLLNAHTKIVN